MSGIEVDDLPQGFTVEATFDGRCVVLHTPDGRFVRDGHGHPIAFPSRSSVMQVAWELAERQ